MQVSSPPSLSATLQGDRGILTLLADSIVWQSHRTARRWQRSEVSLSTGSSEVTLVDDGGIYAFSVVSTEGTSAIDLAPGDPAPAADDGMDAATRVVTPPSSAGVSATGERLSLCLVFDDRIVPFTASALVVGRNPVLSVGQEALVVDDNTVSRTHAELRAEADRVIVRDLGSSNGTFVHPDPGAEVSVPPGTAIPAVPGTRIGFGDVWCRVALG